MHLKQNINIIQFLSDVKKCRSDVFFETTEGDVLNLSSALSQYIFVSIANHPAHWNSGTVRFTDKNDHQFLSDYLSGEEENGL